jgi:branched-chain amino acid aminotransferase
MTEPSQPEFIWFDGGVVPWNEARVHVWTEALLRAASVFEGLRGYWHPGQSCHYFVRLNSHVRRLTESARIIRLPRVITQNELREAIGKLILMLGYREDIYLRPTLYLERGRYALDPSARDCGFFMPVFQVPRATTIESGLRCQISSWRRPDDNTAPPRVKAAANYYNLRLARIEATANGYDEAILLSSSGKVSETAGASVFVVRDGKVATPSTSSSILESITRDCSINLLAETGVAVEEREVDRTELYRADEVFLAGTLCEITPVIDVDGVIIGVGRPGPLTRTLQRLYYDACQAGPGDRRGWLTAGPVVRRQPGQTQWNHG